jgi:hypothetical protein
VARDWLEWHGYYDAPDSALIGRLDMVHDGLRRALLKVPGVEGQAVRVLSMCAGEGRDLLPVLSEAPGGRPVQAVLVEYDPGVASRARAAAEAFNLGEVEIRVADAGSVRTYQDLPPADVVLASGLFGNISLEDGLRTIAYLPALLTPGGIVIWTRASQRVGPSLALRAAFEEHGFTELSFDATADGSFRVGLHQLAAPGAIQAIQGGDRLFVFR